MTYIDAKTSLKKSALNSVQARSVQFDDVRGPNIAFAFQPIIDSFNEGRPFAYEALIRGENGESAYTILDLVSPEERISFDAACRETALEMAIAANIDCKLSLNIVADAACDARYGIMSTLRAARRLGWPSDRLIFEVTEHVPVVRPERLRRWMAWGRSRGFTIALDDFGAGHATIEILLRLRPAMVKLDMNLIRHIDTDPPRRAIVRGLIEACEIFDCAVVAEGVETAAEFETLRGIGVRLMQGYFIARPAIASAPLASQRAIELCAVRMEPFLHAATLAPGVGQAGPVEVIA